MWQVSNAGNVKQGVGIFSPLLFTIGAGLGLVSGLITHAVRGTVATVKGAF